MEDPFDWEDDSKPERPEVCALGLRKYFYFIGAVAVLILAGTYWYTGFYAPQNGTSALFAGSGAADKAPATANGHAPRTQASGAVNARPPVPVANRPQEAREARQPEQQQQIATLPRGPVMQNVGSGGFASVAMALRNSVVNISTTNGSGAAAADPVNPDKIRFANPFSKRSNGSIGSGIIIRDDGYIVSNYHIVRGAGGIVVTVFNNQGTQRYNASIVKMDEVMDLVLLKINPLVPLSAARLGNSSTLRVTDEVIAIGSPFGLDQTVSRGIVSALRKSLAIEGITHANLIQTDTAINQGNSGGPLIASDATVIGINTAIYTPTGAFSGIGFAIPSNQVRQFMSDELGQPLTAARGFTVAAPQQAGPPAPAIKANAKIPGNHRDGRDRMNCASCHQIKGAAGQPVAMPMAAPQQAGPPAPAIRANANIPGNHRDGRDKMNCASCHQIKGAAGQPVAMPVATQTQQAAPVIAANASPPGTHKDGRNRMNCASCHQFLGAAGQAVAMPVAVPQQKGPRISPNDRAPGNHNDGRNKMNCAQCHQFTGGATASLAALTFTKPPSNLAMNVAQPVATFGVPGSNLSVMGAGIMPINAALAERLQQPRDKGVFVSQVAPGSPAAQSGLKSGDIILKVEGKRIWAPGQLADMMVSLGNGNMVRLGIMRNGEKSNLEMLIAMLPAGAGQGMGKGQPSAVMTPRAVPNEFNWRGINVENFIPVATQQSTGSVVVNGAEVDGVTKGSPAAKIGLQPRDVILKINSKPVGKPTLLDEAIRKSRGQTSNLLLVMRGSREFFVILP